MSSPARIFFLALTAILLPLTVSAWVPSQIWYQGYLTNPAGTPLDTVVSMRFRMTDSNLDVPWTEFHPAVTVSKGVFAVRLGSTSPLWDFFATGEQWRLGVTVGSDSMMAPSTLLATVPFAFRVSTVDGTGGGDIYSSVNISGNLHADSLKTEFGVYFPDGTFQSTAGITGEPGQQYYDTLAWDATRSWVKSMGYLRGTNNLVSATGFVGGGDYNNARGDYSVIGGGGGATAADSNSATGQGAAVGGGIRNTAMGFNATIAGGGLNLATQQYGTIAGGRINQALGQFATIAGGESSMASGAHSTVSGGESNNAGGSSATVSGGGFNSAGGGNATVSGGQTNNASANDATISGGTFNVASNTGTTISGGNSNTASGSNATVSGGAGNFASGVYSAVGGGSSNFATGGGSTISGGQNNRARGLYSVVAGGGGVALVDSNSARGEASMIPGGRQNETTGTVSMAAGYRAKALQDGAFVWSDLNYSDFASTAANQFSVRASGGYRLYSNSALTAGVTMGAGASGWTNVSDSTLKRNRRNVDTRQILDKVNALPIQQWSYKSQDPSVEHIGPMAQDFWQQFHLGDDSLGINEIDPSGVALAAIQELARRVRELTDENQRQQAQIQALIADRQQTLTTPRKGN